MKFNIFISALDWIYIRIRRRKKIEKVFFGKSIFVDKFFISNNRRKRLNSLKLIKKFIFIIGNLQCLFFSILLRRKNKNNEKSQWTLVNSYQLIFLFFLSMLYFPPYLKKRRIYFENIFRIYCVSAVIYWKALWLARHLVLMHFV